MAKINVKEMFANAGVENAELESAIETVITNANENGDGGRNAEFRVKKALGQRDDLQGKLTESEVKIDGLNSKINGFTGQIEELGKYKTQVEDWTKNTNTKNLESWNKRKTLFAVKEGEKLFDKVSKVKDKFHLGDELTPEQISANLNLISTYDEIEYFKGEKDATNYNHSKPGGDQIVGGEFYGYDSPQQLAWKDPKLYEKWRKENKK